MSFNVDWDVESHREEHESEEHWHLRKLFMEKWKTDYPEQRLVCLARVFANMELLGCRYPTEVMQEVAGLSHDIAQAYRNSRNNKLKRTFVSASTAAEDRARGIKRKGGIVEDVQSSKSAKISFVPQGFVAANPSNETQLIQENSDFDSDTGIVDSNNDRLRTDEKKSSQVIDANEYLKDMLKVKCLNIRHFHDGMFNTAFGWMVLLIRPWTSKFTNIQSSCQACNLELSSSYVNNCFSLTINGRLLAQATGSSKAEAKSIVETMAWNQTPNSHYHELIGSSIHVKGAK
ncbi:uncharacterized protein LOC113227520 [Hyposmocoma kahamanoa]|uniref:uncharacterized protein LOC113227520 n=1 Tax=Hyposmocoma kahamanoa TaxID=1477025 RepID=UPI000E6D6167|nr:uncharacterized protein LOC113227520 [Hyposmocoma kahamanoa]